MSDSFKVKLKLTNNKVVNKPKWNFKDDHDWTPFTDTVGNILASKPHLNTLDVNSLAKELTSVLSDAAKTSIGFKPLRSGIRRVSTRLPKDIVLAIVSKRSLEASWKSQLTELMKVNPNDRSHDMTKQVQDAVDMARYKVESVPNVVNVQECKDCIECNYFHQKYLYYHTCCLQNVADVENLLNVANIHEFNDCIECQSNIYRSSYMLSTKQ